MALTLPRDQWALDTFTEAKAWADRGDTASTLITEIRYELKDVQDTNYTDKELLVFIGDGVRALNVMAAATWPYFFLMTGQAHKDTQDIATAVADYALPNDFYMTLELYQDDVKLDLITPEAGLVDTWEGYRLEDEQIHLNPTPTANSTDGLVHYYISMPARLSAITDVVPLTPWFGDSIKAFAVLKAKSRQGDNTEAFAALFSKAEKALLALVTRTNQWAQDFSPHVPYNNTI